MSSLAGRIALVTGGSRGIGAEISRELAARGAHVVLTYAGSRAAADGVVASIRDSGGTASAAHADVTDRAVSNALVDAVIAEHGRIDVLVNNAGITRDGLLARMSDEDWDAVIETNLTGAFVMTRAVAKHMMKQRCGAIVNIASVIGLSGNAGQANYAAAKAGMIGLTKSVARELAPRSVRVNAVAPGFIETDMTAALTAPVREAALERIALRRFGTPTDVAKAVAFLASDDAAYITGQVVVVDGGMTF